MFEEGWQGMPSVGVVDRYANTSVLSPPTPGDLANLAHQSQGMPSASAPMETQKAPAWIQLRGIGDRGLMAQMAWNNIEDHRAMATIQLGRIADNAVFNAMAKQVGTQVWAELDVSPEERAGIEHMLSASAMADAHFYLNCWRIVVLNVFRIAKAVGAEALERFLVDQQCPTEPQG